MPLTSRLPRFRLLTLFGLITVIALALTLLPLEEWHDANAINELSKGPFGITVKWERPKQGLAALLPWKRHVTSVVIDCWEPAPGQVQIPIESLLPLQRLRGLEFFQFLAPGSDYPMPPVPRLPQVKTLWLVCNIDPQATNALGQKFPNLEHLYVAPGRTPDETSGMFASVFALPSLKSFECWELRLSKSDVLAMKESKIELIDIKTGLITDEVLAQFASLKTLNELHIWSDELTDGCLDVVVQLKQSHNLCKIYILMPISDETHAKIDKRKLLEARAGQTIVIDAIK